MIEKKRNRTRKLIEEFIIPKCSSKAFILKKGQHMKGNRWQMLDSSMRKIIENSFQELFLPHGTHAGALAASTD
jgi:phage pi2 protein 07